MKISKYLSFLLRHNPENLDMDSNGWVSCEQLIDKLTITFSELENVIKTNNKKRFSFNQDKSKVRANQGHSLSWVNVDMDEIKPPDILYHGTTTRFVSSIKENGLIKGNRNHVHLSDDLETAKTVGLRHGEVFLFEVDAKRMYEDGYKFYLSENGVWLIEFVPKEYLFTKPITRFCFDSCKYLSITESEQDRLKVKYPHFCKRYNKQIKHNGMHPRLPILDECDYNNIEPRKKPF